MKYSWQRNVSVNDSLFQAKASSLYVQWNSGEEPHQKYGSKFRRGWLGGFKKRHAFKWRKSHGEVGNVDFSAAESALPELRALVTQYGESNVFNADEMGLWYKQAPQGTIGHAALPGRKKSKERVSVLLCSNADGSQVIRPLVIGQAHRPRCFGRRSGPGWGWDYAASDRAWMNRAIFFQWLFRFNAVVAATRQQRVLLLLDNASCHGTLESVPELSHVDIYFLPKKTTAILQPMDAGIIASVMKRYKQKQATNAICRLERGVLGNVYNVSLHQSITRMYHVWYRYPPHIVKNCWRKTRMLN